MRRLLPVLVLLLALLPAGPALAADDGPDDRIVIVGPVVVERGEAVQDVVVVDGDVTVRRGGTVRGDLVVIDGDATIRGRVRGDVVTIAGQAILDRQARIGGDLVYADKKPKVARGARVAGDTKTFDGGQFDDELAAIGIGIWIAFTVSLLLLGLLFILLAPRAADAVARTGKTRWGISIGVGIGAIIVLPILVGLAFVTIFGIPLAIVLLCAFVVLYALGYCSTALVIGRLILKKARILAFVVGFLILSLLGLIPFAGGIIGLLAAIFGIGVLLVSLFRARSA